MLERILTRFDDVVARDNERIALWTATWAGEAPVDIPFAGDLTFGGSLEDPPVFHPGQAIHFGNFDAAGQIYHTITACRDPCTGSTGISYPLANGPVVFDSGELGYGPTGLTAAKNQADWYAPSHLAPGTYTYFCRVHPFMRGAFRVPARH